MATDMLFEALRRAGLKHNDSDLAILFDGLDPRDPQFATKARAMRPSLFPPDARTLSPAEYAAARQRMASPAVAMRRYSDDVNAACLAKLAAKYGAR